MLGKFRQHWLERISPVESCEETSCQLDASEGLDSDFGDDLLERDDGKIGKFHFDEFADKTPYVDSCEKNGGLTSRRCGLERGADGVDDELHRIGIECKIRASRSLLDSTAHDIFKFWIEEIDREDRLPKRVFIADVAFE